jgi:hypothetical protein
MDGSAPLSSHLYTYVDCAAGKEKSTTMAEIVKNRNTEKDRDRQRQTETDRDRQRQTETDRDRVC